MRKCRRFLQFAVEEVRKREMRRLGLLRWLIYPSCFGITRAGCSKSVNVITRSTQKVKNGIEITYELGGRVRKVEVMDRCPKTLIGVDFFFEFIALSE